MTRQYDGKYVDPDAYLALAEQKDGSWWPEWHRWLASRSGEPVAPPGYATAASGYAPLGDAPGTYVLAK
jgi:polyhydroxyalkanoate synthase